MNLLSLKFLICAAIVVAIALGGAGLEIRRLGGALNSAKAETQNVKDELEKEQARLALKEAALQISAANLSECDSKIELQNAKFERLEVKRQDAIKAANKAKARFEKLVAPAKTDACEKKLKFYEELMNEMSK